MIFFKYLTIGLLHKIIVNYNILQIILDSKWSNGSSGFTMVFIFFFYPVYKISTRRMLRFQHIVSYLLANWTKMVR